MFSALFPVAAGSEPTGRYVQRRFADVAPGPKAVTEERTFIDIMLKTGWAAATPLPLAFGH
jgi:hypothetical protein